MRRRRKLLTFLPAFVAGLTFAVLALGTPAAAYHTDFIHTCCAGQGCNNTYFDGIWPTRDDGLTYGLTAKGDGYQWGGGCWDLDGHDDSPGDPQGDPATRGEGADCSGFTFKVWRERLTTSDSGWRWHDEWQNTHGPYTAASFRDGVGAPNVTITKGSAVKMDAFASSDHVGMIRTANTAYNTDLILEAKGEAYGTNVWSRTYRGSSAYGGARRLGWQSG